MLFEKIIGQKVGQVSREQSLYQLILLGYQEGDRGEVKVADEQFICNSERNKKVTQEY
jgi:hypothetical protein